jgi:hypothetical protein
MKKTIFTILLFAAIQQTFAQTISDCATCNRVVLSENQLKGKSLEELALLRNEILARKGYKFESPAFELYFSEQQWYKPVNSNDEIQLSAIEQKNVALIKSLENKMQNKRTIAMNDLKKLKTALNENNTQIINEFLGEKMNTIENDWDMAHLKRAMNYIHLDDIHWNKDKGFYSVSIDNGFEIFKCEIVFENDFLRIEARDDGFSKIFKHDVYSTPKSLVMLENEFVMWWIFDITDKGIVLIEINGAG